MTTVKIKDIDRGAKRLAKALANGALSIGVLEADAAKEHDEAEGLTVGEVAAIHEFGLGVPRRSFLAGWCDEKRDEIVAVIVKGGRALVKKQVPDMPTLLDQIGLWAVGSIQERISNRIAPELAPSTIAKKGSSVPLIDKGQLRASISHRVNMAPAGAPKAGP